MDKITVSENRKRNVAALSVMTFCYAAFQGMCQSIVPLSMAHQAYTKTTIGLIQAVPGIIVILFGAPLARMANGRWRRETLSTCLGLAIVALLLYSIASRPMAFVVPQLLYGLSSSAFWSNMIATSFRIAEGSQQARKIQAYVTTFQGVGAFGGPMLGGYLSTFSYMYGFSAGVLIAVIGLVSSRFL